MPLSSQFFIYSVCTDSFYDEEENVIHDRMSKLYSLQSKLEKDEEEKIKFNWKIKSVKRLLAKHKTKLLDILDKKNDTGLVRQLQPDKLKDKSIISLFTGSLSRACEIENDELSTKLFQVEFYFYQVMKDLIYNGFDYDGKHYVYFSSSAGSIRKHRGLFIEEELFNKIRYKLTCGLSIEHINDLGGCVINKWLAYLALSSSATEVWEEFDIDKAIVCDDFEIEVFGNMDYIDSSDYSVTRKYTSVAIPMNDGVGMMLEGPTRVVRGPFIKGLLVQFPFDKFLKEKCEPEQYVVTDIYGVKHNVIEEGIKYIFTKSQLKMWKYFDSWEQYKENFKKYGCEMCWCNMEDPYAPKAKINYQMLNSLHDMTDSEIDNLIKLTVDEIENIGQDYQTTMKLLGATEYNKNPSWFQEALMIYPELFKDPYCRDILKSTKKSLVKQAKAGRLRLNGYYHLASPDLYAYCERLFLGIENPKGLLKNGEVSTKQFKHGEEIDCLRSPHLYFEHCLRVNNRSEEITKWFDTECVYTSCNDLISRVLALDWDGDILLLTNDKTIKKVVKRNQDNYVPLLFDMRKADPVQINSENIYNGLIAAFKYGKIGIYSNNCAKIWGKGKIDENSLMALKLLVAESNWSIDAAKTLYMPERPEKAKELISSCIKGKLPNFFLYAKDKATKQVESPNNSTMNRIAAKIPDPKLRFSKSISKFDYRMLMDLNSDFGLSSENSVIKAYDYWNARISAFTEDEQNKALKNQDMYKYKQLRARVLRDSGKDINYVVNTLVAYLYTIRNTASKKGLWDSFGDVILENLRRNLESKGQVCVICGKRFIQETRGQRALCCSKECSAELDRRQARIRKVRAKEKAKALGDKGSV